MRVRSPVQMELSGRILSACYRRGIWVTYPFTFYI